MVKLSCPSIAGAHIRGLGYAPRGARRRSPPYRRQECWPSVLGISLWLLALAMRGLPLGTAYAVWTGIGSAGAVLAGMIMAREGVDPGRILCVMLILAGVVGLKFLEK